MQRPAQGDRQHENIDQQQVDGEQPARFLQVALVDVFDHRDLKLARQHQEGERGEQHQRRPVGRAAGVFEREQGGEIGRDGRTHENIVPTVVDVERDHHADGQKRDQLDHRLERDRGDHPFVALGGVEVPGAENHRERGQRERHVERGVEIPVARRGRSGAGEQAVFARHRFKLQGDIRHDADHRHQRHHARQQTAFAVTRGNEIGDGGDAIGLADAHHLEQQQRGDAHHQRRPEINRQKADPRRHRPANAAVVGPRGAVHRQRQGIDPGVGNQRTAGVGLAVAIQGHHKQHRQIDERGADDDAAGEHQARSTIQARTAISTAHTPNTYR